MGTLKITDWEIGIICNTQGNIYRLAASMGYNMFEFSYHYMNSEFCKRSMDGIYSRFQFADPEECMDFILPEIGENLTKGEYFDEDVASWIGWMYRFLFFHYHISSEEIQKKLSFKQMCNYFPGMHTIDELQAAEIIWENVKKK